MMKKRLLAVLTALCCVSSMAGLPVGAASHTFEETPTEEWYAAQTELFQDQWVLGEDGVIYLDEDEIEFPFDPYVPNPGTFDRSSLLLSLLHDYPNGKFAVRIDVSFADASAESRVREMKTAPPFIEGANGERYAILTADKLNDFPAYEGAGYRIHLAKASDCAADELTLPIRYFAVVGYDDAKEDFVIMCMQNGDTFYLTDEYAAEYMREASAAIRYGDILRFKGQAIHTERAGTNDIRFVDPQAHMSEETPEVGYIDIIDSVFVNGTEAQYEVMNHHSVHVMLAREDKQFHYNTDFTASYPQLSGVDWSTTAIGDVIDFVTYAGRPVLPVDRKAQQTTGEFAVIEAICQATDGSGRMAYLTNTGLYLDSMQIGPYLTEGSAMPALGDVIVYSVETLDMSSPMRAHFGENSYITNLGPAWEYYDGRIELTVKSVKMDELNIETYYELEEPETDKTFMIGLKNNWEYCFGTEPLHAGDVMTFVTNEKGHRVYLMSADRLGDANADGDVSIVDVVMVNRHVMGADMTSTTMNTDAADFDKNGEVTHEDSLSILKRLVGLV
ncbi:MAG: dockerin type I repeat-containing protein [Oscillospiraceae bacterium]|nr:dockerin type I repeat-containing protein [Oscillospiraceae bacterium]